MTPEMNTCMIWIYIYINICWYIMPCWVVNLNIIIWNLWFLWCYSFCWPDILNNQRLVKKNNTKKNMFQRLLHGFRGSFSHWAHNNGVPTGEPHSAPRIWPNKINAPRVFVKGPHCFMHDKHLNDSKKNHLDVTTSGFFNFEIIFSTFNSKKTTPASAIHYAAHIAHFISVTNKTSAALIGVSCILIDFSLSFVWLSHVKSS